MVNKSIISNSQVGRRRQHVRPLEIVGRFFWLFFQNSLLPINTTTGVTNTIEASQYAQLGQQVKEQITINGKNVDATKIANNVYYSDTLGIAVGTQGTVFDVSQDFKTGISKQNTDNILVISCLVDESSLLTVIIVKEPSTNVYKVASANYIKHSFNSFISALSWNQFFKEIFIYK